MLIKPCPIKQVTQEELEESVSELNKIFIAELMLSSTVPELVKLHPHSTLRDKLNVEKSAHAGLPAVRLLYQAGRFTKPEYVFFTSIYLEGVHESCIIAGDYDVETDPITNKIDEIRKLHGLSDGEYWSVGEGPEEYKLLNKEYSKIHDLKFIEIFREFGENELATLLETDSDKFWDLREQGRCHHLEKKKPSRLLLYC